MKRIVLSIALLFITSPVYCQNQASQPNVKFSESDKEQICAQQFDFVLAQLKILSNKYPVLASIEKDLKIFKQPDSDGMSYDLELRKNFFLLKNKRGPIDPKLPYVYVSFCLKPSKGDTGQFVVSHIDEYISKRWQGSRIFNRFNSGIFIAGEAFSDNAALKKEIYNIFDKVIHRILEWEKQTLK